MAFSAFVTSITQDRFLPKVVDNILAGNVLCERFLGNARPWGSGHQLVIPIKYTTNTSVDSYSGFDTLSTTQMNTRVTATVDPRQVYGSVVISNIQQAVNKGDAAVLDLLATEMDSIAADLSNEIGTQFYADGTGNSSKDFTGLDAIIDDGNGTGTFEGLLRTTYTTWVSTYTSNSGALTKANLQSALDSAKIGNDNPTLIVTTPAIWTALETLLAPTPSYFSQVQGYPKLNRFGINRNPGTGQTGDYGFDTIFFRGIPVVADEKCTSGTLWVINENHLWFAKLAHPKYGDNHGFAWTGLKEPTNQDASVGQFLLYGNLVADSCRTHAYMTSKS